MANSADPDQLAPSKNCLQRQGISRFSGTRVKGNGCYVMEDSVKTILNSFLKMSTVKAKNLLHLGANSISGANSILLE